MVGFGFLVLVGFDWMVFMISVYLIFALCWVCLLFDVYFGSLVLFYFVCYFGLLCGCGLVAYFF